MKLTILATTAALVGHVAAIDLYLFRGRYCQGTYYQCSNAAPNTCCQNGASYLSSGALNGDPDSGRVRSFVANGPEGPFSCTGPYTADEKVGTCIASSQYSTRAITYFSNNKRSDALPPGDCEDASLGEHMFSDGKNTYVISRAKMEEKGLELPFAEEDREDFFKMHADSVADAPSFDKIVDAQEA